MNASWPFGEFRPLSYGVLLVDPPWRYENWSKNGEWKNAARHYDCLTLEELKAIPVGHLATRDAVLVLWATNPMLPDALELMRAWGFRYVSAGAWVKQSRSGRTIHFGTGYTLRSSHEPFLIGSNGQPSYHVRNLRSVILAPVREHSRKPDEIYVVAEGLNQGPKIELFARQTRPGWDSWGLEVDKFEPTEDAA